jgi:hypothetical protein
MVASQGTPRAHRQTSWCDPHPVKELLEAPGGFRTSVSGGMTKRFNEQPPSIALASTQLHLCEHRATEQTVGIA